MQLSNMLMSSCLAGAALVAAAPAAAQATSFDLPAQSLSERLGAIARATGREAIFDAKAVAGRVVAPLRGRFTFEEAVRLALADTGLAAQFRGNAAIIGARAAAAGPIAADEPITVTGSRIRGARSASPVIATRREALEDAGAATLTDFARLIPQNFTGGQNPGVVGAGQGGQSNINNSTTLNLRGLGPDATLTLINGHRIAYDAVVQGVDIGVIPLAAVERIEVIADGASALYGSDAVAGVANIILRREFDGAETRVRLGASTGGGNVQQQYSLVTGARWTGGGVMIAADHSRSTAIEADDRDYTRGLDDSATLLPRQRQWSGVLAAHQQLNDNLTFELDAQAASRRSEKANVFFTTSDVNTNGLLNRPQVDSFAITPAIRARLPHGWALAAAYTHAESTTRIDGVFTFASVSTSSRVVYENFLDAVDLTAEGPLLHLPGGPVRLALGGGFRTVQLDNLSFDTTGGGSVVTRNITETRNILSAYGELSVPLVGPGNGGPLIHSLRLTGAARYERYEGLEEVVTPKVGLIYQPAASLTFSATWGRSFKVPTLFQVNQNRTGSLFAGSRFSPQPTPALPAGSTVLVLSGGNPDLEAERARNWTVTAEWRPDVAPGLRLQASYFDIDYRGRVVSPLSGIFNGLGNPLLASLVTRDPSPATVSALVASLPAGLTNQTTTPFDPAQVAAILDGSLRNAAREAARGIDFSGDYRLTFGGGSLQFDAAASYIEGTRQFLAGQPSIERAGRIFNPPHWRWRAGASWQQEGLQLGLSVNHVGSTIDDRLQPLEEVGSFTTLDATARYRVAGGPLRGVELRLTVLNLLDENPDPIRNSDPAAPPFDSTNQSAIGRFVGVQVGRRW